MKNYQLLKYIIVLILVTLSFESSAYSFKDNYRYPFDLNSQPCNCVFYARRSFVPDLPYDLELLSAKVYSIKTQIPKVGYTVVMNPLKNEIGHVGVVMKVTDTHITVRQSNWPTCVISEKTFKRDYWSILGYIKTNFRKPAVCNQKLKYKSNYTNFKEKYTYSYGRAFANYNRFLENRIINYNYFLKAVKHWNDYLSHKYNYNKNLKLYNNFKCP